MRPVFFAWRLPELAEDQARAEKRSSPVDLRRVARAVAQTKPILEQAFGPGSVLKLGVTGEAQTDAARLACLADLREKLLPVAGRVHFGVGVIIEEAQRAAQVAERRRVGVAVWSPEMAEEAEDLSKSAGMSKGAASGEPSRPISPKRVEARLRAHADTYAARQRREQAEDVRLAQERRQRAGQALEHLRESGKLAEMAVKDPPAFAEVMQLVAALEGTLEKSGTFHGLPLPRRVRMDLLPPGTRVKGKLKVDTPEGSKWVSGRKGLVSAPEAAQTGGRSGRAAGAASAG